jgi:ornithine carbamoyltransferase
VRHLLEVDDLSPAELAEVLALTRVTDPPPVLAGRGVALIFEKPSNRTRNATEMAAVALGAHPVVIHGDEIGLGAREPVEDVVRVLAGFHALVGARVFEHGTLEAMVAPGAVPIVNLLSDRGHPCQAIADLMTLEDHWGSLKGRRLAWVGDGNNVARSLTLAAAMTGVDVALACPPGHALDDATVSRARELGIEVVATTDPTEAVRDADAVCTDVWVSMGEEDRATTKLDAFAGYQVDAALMGRAAPGAAFLHCLPAHRGQEVAGEVIDGPSSLVWTQAHNRLHAARAALAWLSGVRP